jgi:hypothetical protein
MIGFCLVIETPRAGDAGHRFLTSCSDVGESEIARVMAEASRTPVSDTFISVSRQVTQTLKNSTVREGTERIILNGVKVGDLEQSDIDAVQVALTKLFVPLQRLTDTLSWQSIERTTVILRPELQGWIDRPEFRKLPTTKSAARTGRLTQDTVSIPKRRLPRRAVAWAIVATGIATLVVAVAILVKNPFNGGAGPDPRPPEPPGQAAFQQLARDWDCTPDELGVSLLRAANWDRREQADVIGLDAMLADGEVLAIMDKVKATSHPAQLLVSPAVERDDRFRRLVMDRGAKSANDARALRRWLFASWQRFSELKRDASHASDFLREIQGGDAFSRAIMMISEVQLDVGTGEGFREPATPLFDRQDVMIYRALEHIHQRLGDAGVAQVLIAENANGGSDLPTFVARLEESRDRIPRLIGESRRTVIDQVPAEGVRVVRDDAYKSLEQFLLQLSTFGRG